MKTKRSVICKENAGKDFKFENWKSETRKKAKIICDYSYAYNKPNDVLRDIYEYMRRNYGIVWECDFYHFSQKYCQSARYLDVIYDNKMYKSIFDSILNERVDKIKCQKVAQAV